MPLIHKFMCGRQRCTAGMTLGMSIPAPDAPASNELPRSVQAVLSLVDPKFKHLGILRKMYFAMVNLDANPAGTHTKRQYGCRDGVFLLASLCGPALRAPEICNFSTHLCHLCDPHPSGRPCFKLQVWSQSFSACVNAVSMHAAQRAVPRPTMPG